MLSHPLVGGKGPLLSKPVIGNIFCGFSSSLQTEVLQRTDHVADRVWSNPCSK